jgi:Zn-dependent protease with chaperone function
MNFFEQQDIARRNTRLLVLLFLAAVLLLIILTNLAFAGFMWFSQDYNIYSGSSERFGVFLANFSWTRFASIGLAVAATVAMVALLKWLSLSSGGKVVAESMGGTRILPGTLDPAERRCLNVVEEIALAATMPVPPVYVMNDERGINAFAAGLTPADAVVAVTRGTIDHLKRDELQGVIAHEFSHILNGDMRLNIHLAAMLKGITFVGDVGHILLRSTNRARTGLRARDNNVGPMLPLLGLVLWLLGLVGAATAGFIKAAISRQKEYLADASAVQYTRNPDGIGDALKVIGGYIPGTLVHAARAAEMSHIFFGEIEHRLWNVFATHPPLQKRIRRLDPDWNGEYIQRKVEHYRHRPANARQAAEVGVGRAALVAAALAAAAARPGADPLAQAMEPEQVEADFGPALDELETETARQQDIPLVFVRHAHEPLGAHALIYSLLISREESVRQAQLDIVRGSGITGLVELVHTLSPGVQALGAPRRLPLLEMCLPALKSMSLKQYRLFKRTLLGLIRADARTDLYEWCMYQLLRHYLDPEFIQVKPSRPRYAKLQKVAYHVRVVLSVLAHEGSGETAAVFRLGADELGFDTMAILPRDQCGVASFSKAVHELADCYPLLKPRLLKAMALAAGADGKLSPVEREIIASMAAVMDCPVALGEAGQL